MEFPGPGVSFYHIFLRLDDMETFFLKDNLFDFEFFFFLIFFQLDVIFYAPE